MSETLLSKTQAPSREPKTSSTITTSPRRRPKLSSTTWLLALIPVLPLLLSSLMVARKGNQQASYEVDVPAVKGEGKPRRGYATVDDTLALRGSSISLSRPLRDVTASRGTVAIASADVAPCLRLHVTSPSGLVQQDLRPVSTPSTT